jgi:CheY-like chemotaxis protein
MEAIGQLTGGIAHDFNNLLTGIIGAMHALKRRIDAGRYDDTQRFMDAAVTSANRAAALTHRLLAFARRQPLDPKPIDGNQLVRGIEDLLRRTVGEQIQIKMDLDPTLWPTFTDDNQLESALLNLVINARDAMPEGGRLTITTRNVVMREFHYQQDDIEPGEYTVISVGDTGVGIPPENLSKVFEPFFTTKPIGQGTGLGLSMIYGFAKQSRGGVRIETALGHGTTVSVYLPRHIGVTSEHIKDIGAFVPTGAGERVLLVEDDSSVRLLIADVLREHGYYCIEACDAHGALPVLESDVHLDLMISDVGLPGLNGRQLAENARKRRPGLKVLFVTGYADQATGSRPFLEPGMEMVTKPFLPDALASKIHQMIAG